jgi:hypothetical protein
MWDNDNVANIVCRQLGFDYGTLYTFGVSSQLQQLPVVWGFRKCAGNEQSIFSCPQPDGANPSDETCNNHAAGAFGSTHNACTGGVDSTCTHAIDQGAVCFHGSESSQLMPSIPPCQGCKYGCSSGGMSNEHTSGNHTGQPIIFGCIDFYSAHCQYDATAGGGSYDSALAEFAACAETVPEPQGYCHGALTTAGALRNQDVCLYGAREDIAFHIRIPFHVYAQGQYSFRMHADYGLGSFIGVDGAEHTPGNTWGHLQSDPVSLTMGDHEFEALGFEDCCDGHSELEVHLPCDSLNPNAPWRIVQAGDTDCLMCPPPPPPFGPPPPSPPLPALCSAATDSAAVCNGAAAGGATGQNTQNCLFGSCGFGGSSQCANPTNQPPPPAPPQTQPASRSNTRISCTHSTSNCKHGRLEVMDGAGTWGTVCGHWLWDNDNAADIACRAQGFAAGSIYTYGATTALPVLPIVMGYRSCEGTEANLFMCAQCGNRVQQNGCTSAAGCIDPTTNQPVCTAGLDGSQHCCSWEGGQEEADSLQGCSHSIDQGVICYTQQEMQGHTNQMNAAVPCEGVSCPSPAEQLEQCHGCGQGCSLADNGAQAIVFGCVDFWSAPCAYDASNNGDDYGAALSQFATCAENPQSPATMQNIITRPNTFSCLGGLNTCTTPDWNQRDGYCHGSLRSAKYLSNQVVCGMGSNVAIGFHIRIPFRNNNGGTYTFRMLADYGLGSFIGVDGAEHTPGNTWGHVQTDPVFLTAGDHEFEALGFEDCCDGHAELELHLPCDRTTDNWRIVVAGESTCMDCNAQQATPASCSAQTGSAGVCANAGANAGGSAGPVNPFQTGSTDPSHCTPPPPPTGGQTHTSTTARLGCTHTATGTCRQGRMEVLNPRMNGGSGGWGTVCGHWLWNNDKAASIFCRQLGYSFGQIYTYGASASLAQLPVAAGFRECTGSEMNILDCPMGGATPSDPQCVNGCDVSCTHSIDQGAICMNAQSTSQLMPSIAPCQGCKFGCSVGGTGGQHESLTDQTLPIIFGCIDFYTARCHYDATNGGGSYQAALSEFATCAEVEPEPTGYCHGAISSAAALRNQDVCMSGSTTDIGFHIRIPFRVNPVGTGAYSFRMHADYGLGSFIGVDGAEHTPGNTWGHMQSDPVMLTAGDHEFESLGFEDCCDGHAELEVHLPCDRTTSPWRIVQASDRNAAVDCMSSDFCNGTPLPPSCSAGTTSAGQCNAGAQGGSNGGCTGLFGSCQGGTNTCVAPPPAPPGTSGSTSNLHTSQEPSSPTNTRISCTHPPTNSNPFGGSTGCKHGRLEVKDSSNTWGTVCGHWYWDNEEIAHMACRANGFASGSVYTFGATTLALYAATQPAPIGVLPVIAGYRTCTGTEPNIFQCPECGSRIAQYGCQSWAGCTDSTTQQPVCTDAMHCCADQQAANTLSGCSHSVDQGVICYADQEYSQVRADIIQCHGCAHGCALDSNGGQAIVFGCVDYWTAQCHYDATNNGGSYDAALAEFATCAEVSPSPLGYCHGSLQTAAALSNQAICACIAPGCTANNEHIGFHIRIPFRNNMGKCSSEFILLLLTLCLTLLGC